MSCGTTPKTGFKVTISFFFLLLFLTFSVLDFQSQPSGQNPTPQFNSSNPFLSDISFDFPPIATDANPPPHNTTPVVDPFSEFSLESVATGNNFFEAPPPLDTQSFDRKQTEPVVAKTNPVSNKEERRSLDWTKNANVFRSLLSVSEETHHDDEWTDFKSVSEEKIDDTTVISFAADLVAWKSKFQQDHMDSYHLYSQLFEAKDNSGFHKVKEFMEKLTDMGFFFITKSMISNWKILLDNCERLLLESSSIFCKVDRLDSEEVSIFFESDKTNAYAKSLSLIYLVVSHIGNATRQDSTKFLNPDSLIDISSHIDRIKEIWNKVDGIFKTYNKSLSSLDRPFEEIKNGNQSYCNLCCGVIGQQDNVIYRASKPYLSYCLNLWVNCIGKEIM